MPTPNASAADELDAELLAVTEGQKRGGRARDDLSDGSASSGGQFDGVSDIEGADDDDEAIVDEDDEDDEDDEYGLDDDDDDDFDAKQKSRSRKKPVRRKASKSRAKPKRKPQAKRDRPSLSEEEEQFVYKYDKDGYGDDADRDRLSKMNEFDRERVLADRLEERTKEFDLWKMKKEMMARDSGKFSATAERKARSSGRNKASSKSDALQALAEDKRKKTSRALDEVSDADSETDLRPKRVREERDRPRRGEHEDELNPMSVHEGPELRYSDLVKIDKGERRTSYLFLRRNTIVELSQKPFFARVIGGLYARIRVANDSHDDDAYLLCRIVGAETRKVYSLSLDLKTNWCLILQSGRQQRRFQIDQTSASAPSEREFAIYRERALSNGFALPRREEVDKLVKRTKEMFFDRTITPTEEENKKHIANMEILYPSRVNWTRKKAEARTAYDIKLQELSSMRHTAQKEDIGKFQKEVEVLRDQLHEIEENEKLYGIKSEVKSENVFQGLAERNMMLNTSNEKLMEKRRNLESAAGGIDPFARFDTTGQSYFSIKRKGEKNEDEKAPALRSNIADWRSCLKTWGTGTKRKVEGQVKAIDPIYAQEFEGLEDFQKEFPDANCDSQRELGRNPGVDEVYIDSINHNVTLPADAKVTSFEEWYKVRMA